MGKKGKGKGKKGGKKGGKSKEPQMTFQEAILAYKVNILDKKLEDMKYEVRGWEEKNKRSVERNEKWKDEQELLIQNLLKQAQDYEKVFEGEDGKGRDHVVSVMKDVWHRRAELEKEVDDVLADIKKKELEIEGVEKEVVFWTNYRDKGQHDRQKHIRLLEQELADLQSSFELMANHLKGSLDTTKFDIKKRTDDALDQQKYFAAEKAMAKLDKQSRQEVLDNDWLRREVEIHKRECDELYECVSDLEQKNLTIMSELFDCKVEDLKISRNLFLTQIEDGESLDNSGILEMDLNGLSLEERLTSADLEKRADMRENAIMERPKSATLRAIEDRILPLLLKEQEQDDLDDVPEDDDDADSTDMDVLGDDFFLEELNDYLKLGPLELKLLNVTGTAVPIHKPFELSGEELQAKQCQPDEWPITQPMLREIL